MFSFILIWSLSHTHKICCDAVNSLSSLSLQILSVYILSIAKQNCPTVSVEHIWPISCLVHMLCEETQTHIPTNTDTQNGLQWSANGKIAQMLSPCGVVCETIGGTWLIPQLKSEVMESFFKSLNGFCHSLISTITDVAVESQYCDVSNSLDQIVLPMLPMETSLFHSFNFLSDIVVFSTVVQNSP